MLMEQQTVTNPAVIHDLCAMTKTLHQQCMLAQAHPPPMMMLLVHNQVLQQEI